MTTEDFRKEVGKRIRFYREKTGLTQEQLGRLVNANRFYISQIESGRKNVSVTRLSEILKVLDLKMEISFI